MTDHREPIRPIYAEPHSSTHLGCHRGLDGERRLALHPANYSASFSGSLLTEILGTLGFTLLPTPSNIIHMFIRKAAHCTEYGIFSLLLFHSFTPRRQGGGTNAPHWPPSWWPASFPCWTNTQPELRPLPEQHPCAIAPSTPPPPSPRSCCFAPRQAARGRVRRNTPMGQSIAG